MSKELTRPFGRPRRDDSSALAAPTNLQARLRASLAAQTAQSAQSAPTGGTCLLLDRTGSMWGEPIVKLREAVRDFKGIRRFEYADDIRELRPGEEVGEPSGGNNEPLAFTHIKNLGLGHVILVTDGVPDDARASLIAAKGLKIDVIYIGPEPQPKFLRDLAAQTGGTYQRDQILVSTGLTTKIKGLLAPPPEPGGGGVIAL